MSAARLPNPQLIATIADRKNKEQPQPLRNGEYCAYYRN